MKAEALAQYNTALKAGQKYYKTAVSRGKYPYPLVLDEILPESSIAGYDNLGILEIPTDSIIGTRFAGRKDARFGRCAVCEGWIANAPPGVHRQPQPHDRGRQAFLSAWHVFQEQQGFHLQFGRVHGRPVQLRDALRAERSVGRRHGTVSASGIEGDIRPSLRDV